jgi:hypothetical protein
MTGKPEVPDEPIPERERVLNELIEKPGERERIVRDAQLSRDELEEVLALVETADLLWLANQGAPPLEEDPVAVRLGLVPAKGQAGTITRFASRRLALAEKLTAVRAEMEREVLADVETRVYRSFMAADEDNTDLNAMTVPELTALVMTAIRGETRE